MTGPEDRERDLTPGRVVAGRFEVVRSLGEGAMGAVLEALDRDRGGARVALKVLLPSLGTDASARRRFRREARVLASLAHPAIVRVVDHGVDEDGSGRPWLAMELVDGQTLAARLADTGVFEPRALSPILDALAGGLGAVHEHGIVHGDVKPENVMLIPGGEGATVRLVDFGLAKVEGLERLTRTGELSGTPAYLAPELITGESPLDHRADVYGLGVVLYEALSGSPPYAGTHPGKLLFAVATGRRRPLSEVRPSLAPEVVAVVDRALSPSPRDRHPTAAALAEDFRRAC